MKHNSYVVKTESKHVLLHLVSVMRGLDKVKWWTELISSQPLVFTLVNKNFELLTSHNDMMGY